MVDYIAFNYKTRDPEHLQAIADKLAENRRSMEMINSTPIGKRTNKIHPMQIKLLSNDRVFVTGSIHKYWNSPEHTNDNDFTWKDFIVAIKKLMAELKIDLAVEDPKVTHLEIGLNFLLPFAVDEFLDAAIFYKNRSFRYCKPKKGTTKEWGKESINTDYTIKCYNKSWLTNKELKWAKYSENKLLRFEISYESHLVRYLKCETINGILKSKKQVVSTIKTALEKIEFRPDLDYSKASTEEISFVEAFSSPNFSHNVRRLTKYKKRKLDLQYEVIKKRTSGNPRLEAIRKQMIAKLDKLS